MWQRKQTIYMILVIGLMIATVLLPDAFFFNDTNNISYQLDTRGLVELNNNKMVEKTTIINPLPYLLAIILFISTFVIAGYKNRKKQIRLAIINLILILIYCLGSASFIYYILYNNIATAFTLNYSIIFPVIALIFNIMAIRGIRKDEKLIQSMNRLR